MLKSYIKLINDKDIQIRLMIFAIGFSPITSLSLSTFNLVPLYIAGPFVVLPAIVSAFAIGSLFPRYRRTLIQGFLLGVCAVFLYDLTCRFPFIIAGLWPDFIPKIGDYLLHHDHVHWLIGYLWRYIGNGGGMGLAFYVIYPLIGIRAKSTTIGTIYGILIFCCALITIYCSPSGRTYLFDPTLLTGLLGLMGHIVFGYVLGYGVKLFPDQALRMTVEHSNMSMLPADLTPTLQEDTALSRHVIKARHRSEVDASVNDAQPYRAVNVAKNGLDDRQAS